MVVKQKKLLQGSTINNDLREKLYGVKTMRLLECHMHWLTGKETNLIFGGLLFPSF